MELFITVSVGNIFKCFVNFFLEGRIINLFLKHLEEKVAVNGKVNGFAKPAGKEDGIGYS